MSPQAALDRQIDQYRAMSGEERLSVALNLHELACEVTREGIRHQHPEFDQAEVNRLLRERLELARHL
jgi:type II secretory pathway predicted ATPase ExeA